MIWIVGVLLLIIIVLLIKIHSLKNKNINEKMHKLIQVQSQHGTYDYNEYELGMWQGMENMLAKYENRKPLYMDINEVNFIDSYRKK